MGRSLGGIRRGGRDHAARCCIVDRGAPAVETRERLLDLHVTTRTEWLGQRAHSGGDFRGSASSTAQLGYEGAADDGGWMASDATRPRLAIYEQEQLVGADRWHWAPPHAPPRQFSATAS